MAIQLKSQSDYYQDYRQEVQNEAPELTDFNDGSINDIEAGVMSSATRELALLISDQFRKTFFSTSFGPDATGGDDDLQTLAVDRYGSAFARPGATPAIGTVTFTRPTFLAGGGTILAGQIVKTVPDAAGNSQRFSVISLVTVGPTTLTINASVRAVTSGIAGNVDPSTIKVIENPLFDPTFTVNNTLRTAGGSAAMDDPTYLQFILNLVETLKGGTNPGIEALAKTIPGIVMATVIENQIPVIQWNIANSVPIGAYFRIPQVILYVADVNGSASDALVAQVASALINLRATGVQITTKAATALPVNWMASIILNPLGPNFATLENDATQIVDSMNAYLSLLPIGSNFVRKDARTQIMAIWGPAGTNDLTDFINIVPVGDVAAASYEKLVSGTVGIQ